MIALATGPHEARADMPGFNLPLNGFRGFCALMVFLFHLGDAGVLEWTGTPASATFGFLGTSLAYGVELFFMISGFVILGSLLRHRSVGGFLKDRAIRIFSAWVPALVAIALASGVLGIGPFAGLNAMEASVLFLANLFLLPPLAPLPLVHLGSWSLTYEWVFYFAAAGGLVLFRRHGSASWPVIGWTLLAGLFIVLYPPALFFLTGVIVFRQRAWFEQHRRWLAMPIVSLALFLLAWRLTEPGGEAAGSTFLQWIQDGRWLAAVIAFIASLHLFASVTLAGARQADFLKSRLFQFLGNISYSFYLWHLIVMAPVKRVVTAYVAPFTGSELAFVVFAITAAVLSLAVSWGSWRVFEVALASRLRKAAPAPSWRSAHAAS